MPWIRTAANTTESDARAMEEDWKSRPLWVLNDEAYDRIMEKLRNGSEGEWSYLNYCPHQGPDRRERCTCPKMLNVAHPEFGMCRMVNDAARPVIAARDLVAMTTPEQ